MGRSHFGAVFSVPTDWVQRQMGAIYLGANNFGAVNFGAVNIGANFFRVENSGGNNRSGNQYIYSN